MKDDNKTKKQLIDELSELRSPKAALKKSENEEKYRSLVENIRDVIYELDSQGVVLYISPAVRDLLGFEPTEIIGKSFTELTHKDDLNNQMEWFTELRKGTEKPSEYRVFNKSGDTRWARTETRPIMENGQFKGARGILIDITEQRRAENALRESEGKYRDLVKHAPAGIYEVDYETNLFISVNDVICEYTGYTREELLSINLFTLLTEESQKLMFARLEKLMAGEQLEPTVEYCIRTKDGNKLWALFNARYIYEAGKLKGSTGVIYNVTERNQAREKLQKSEERYRTILEDIDEGYFEIDLAGNFTFVNDAECRDLGYSHEELIGMNYRQYSDEATANKLREIFHNIYNTGKSIKRFSGQFISKDGRRHFNETSASILQGAKGEPIGFRGISQDVTERKRAEAKLRQQTDAMDAATDGMALCNAEEEYVYINKAHATLYGYEKVEELIGKSWRTLYDSDVLQRFDQEIMPEFSRKGAWRGEAVGTKKNGAKFPQELSLTAMTNGGLICVVRDITERKQAEEAIKDAQTRYRLLFEHSPDGIVIIDPGTAGLLEFNETAHRQLGYSREEFARLNISDFDASETPKETRLRITKVIQEGRMDFETLHRTRQGEIRNVHVTAQFTEILGKPVYHCIWRDITDRKRVEEALRERGSEQRWLLESITNAFVVFESVFDEQGKFISYRFQYINKAYERITGVRNEEVKGKTVHEVWPETEDSWIENYGEVAVTGITKEFNMYHDPTKKLYSCCAYRPWDTKDRFCVIFDDITERKQAEKKLEETLDSLRKAVGVTVQVMVSAIESRDPYTSGHQLRVANLARAIATEMELPQDTIEGLRMAGSIHDIGKLSIPAEILSKPTKLTNIEFSLIQEHSRIGYEILKDVESPWPLAQIVYQHHERMNGSGYPRNLRGEEICMEARILAVADVVEAMASHRPYRPGLGIGEALNEIEKNRGIFYDEAVVGSCLRLFQEKGFKFEGS